MKRIFLATAAAAVLSTSAALASDQLRMQLENEFQTSNMMVDVSLLTDEQVNALYLITTSTDAQGEKVNKIDAVLEDNGFVQMRMGETMIYLPRNDLMAQIQNGVADFGYEVDMTELSEAEVAELYLAVNTSDREEARAKIESVLQ